MTQEVQTTLNYQAELNRTEGIGYQERRISDKMQVRDKFSNGRDGSTTPMTIHYDHWTSAPGWTVNSTSGGVTYKVDGGDIIIPLAGAYLAEITTILDGSSTYKYTLQLWVNGKSRFSQETSYDYHGTFSTILNLGRKDRVTLAGKAASVWTSGAVLGLKLIKL